MRVSCELCEENPHLPDAFWVMSVFENSNKKMLAPHALDNYLIIVLLSFTFVDI